MPLLGAVYLIALVLIVRRSSAPLSTFLRMIGTIAVFIAVALLLALLIPNRVGALGTSAAIFGQIMSIVVGIAHLRSLPNRSPQMPRNKSG